MDKKVKKFEKYLQKCIDTQEVVKIYRDVTDGESDLYGYIVDKSDDFLVIHNENEFLLDGYTIIRKDQFDYIRCDEYDETIRIINEGEGLNKKVGLKKPLKLNSWKSIFKQLKKNDYHVTVECEYMKNPTFTIGPIIKVGDRSVEITYFDATGKLDKKPTKIKYKDISQVRFATRYTKVFKKYVFK